MTDQHGFRQRTWLATEHDVRWYLEEEPADFWPDDTDETEHWVLDVEAAVHALLCEIDERGDPHDGRQWLHYTRAADFLADTKQHWWSNVIPLARWLERLERPDEAQRVEAARTLDDIADIIPVDLHELMKLVPR